MTWNLPKTNWQPDEIVTAADMNEIGQNLITLRNAVSSIDNIDHASDFTTSSVIFVNVDPNTDASSNVLGSVFTSSGRPVMVSFVGSITHSSSSDVAVYFDLLVDGTRIAGDDGLLRVTARSGEARNASFVYWLDNLAAGEHTVLLRWRVTSGTATLWAGAGTTNADVHPQFAVHELA